MSIRSLVVVLIVALLSGGLVSAHNRSRDEKPVRVRLKKSRKKVQSGGTGQVRVVVRNRTRDERTVTLEIRHKDSGELFFTDELHLSPREKMRFLVPCTVPVGFGEKRLEVEARIGESVASTKMRVIPMPGSPSTPDPDPDPAPDPDWVRGRELYLANCSACHGPRGDHEIRGESLGDWREAVNGDEDEMPAIPGLSTDDLRMMRLYVKDPDRPFDPGEPLPPPAVVTYTNSIKAVLDQSCAVCHKGGSASAGVELDTFDQASTNASRSLNSVEKNNMPPLGPLPQATKDLLRKWVENGAPE